MFGTSACICLCVVPTGTKVELTNNISPPSWGGKPSRALASLGVSIPALTALVCVSIRVAASALSNELKSVNGQYLEANILITNYTDYNWVHLVCEL